MGGAEPASTVDPIDLNGDLRLPFPAERIRENEAARIVLIGPAGLLFEGADLASDGDRAARLSLELEIAVTNHKHQIKTTLAGAYRCRPRESAYPPSRGRITLSKAWTSATGMS